MGAGFCSGKGYLLMLDINPKGLTQLFHPDLQGFFLFTAQDIMIYQVAGGGL
jgi:hypothetical protein